MARWKARVDFTLTAIELLFYLTVDALHKAKRVKTYCFLEGWVSLSQDFREKRSFVGNIFWFLEN